MNLLKLSGLAGLAICGALVSNLAFAELPQVSNARVIQPPPSANVAAAYFDLTNPSDQSLEISGVVSDAADRAELHLSKVENDVAKMVKQDQITLDAGESLAFEQGSYHVMLMGLNEELIAGSSLQITLQTSAGELVITVPVITPDDATAMPDSHGDKHLKHGHDTK